MKQQRQKAQMKAHYKRMKRIEKKEENRVKFEKILRREFDKSLAPSS